MELFLQGLRKSAGSPEKTEITVPWGEGAKGGNEAEGEGGVGQGPWEAPLRPATAGDTVLIR